MERLNCIRIRKFRDEDQEKVKKLILDGLVEHWGCLDESKNPDLDNIAQSYESGIFLVADHETEIVGCGAIKSLANKSGEIVRMSIAKPFRRQGIGSLILTELIKNAVEVRMGQIELETTANWFDAISFYKYNGFLISKYEHGNVYFIRKII